MSLFDSTKRSFGVCALGKLLALAALQILAANMVFAQGAQELEALRKLDASIDALVRKVSPSVVQVVVTSLGPLEENKSGNAGAVVGQQHAVGSGFVLEADGYIVTNAHVIRGAQRVEVIVPVMGGTGPTAAIQTALSTRTRMLPARVVGQSEELDLALLKIDASKLPALPLAGYRDLRQGETVFAFGSPEGLRNSVTHGIVSAVARQIDTDSPRIFIQTDTPINPGNSGGPLVNVNGEVVGVNTFILSQSGGNEGLGFAIPSATVRVVARQLKQFGRVRRQEIGIGMQTITPTMAGGLGWPQNYGVVVSDVLPGGTAEAAGLMVGDILVSLDDQPAENLPTVSYFFLSRDLGDTVRVVVQRGKTRETFNVTIDEEKRDFDDVLSLADAEKNVVRDLGIVGVEIDKKVAGMARGLRDPFGIIVAARTEGGSEVALVPGDVIRSLNNYPTTTLERLRSALQQLTAGSAAVLQIQRDRKLMYVAFTKR